MVDTQLKIILTNDTCRLSSPSRLNCMGCGDFIHVHEAAGPLQYYNHTQKEEKSTTKYTAIIVFIQISLFFLFFFFEGEGGEGPAN